MSHVIMRKIVTPDVKEYVGGNVTGRAASQTADCYTGVRPHLLEGAGKVGEDNLHD